MKRDEELLAAAVAARTHAYAPYSSFAVGAALRLHNGTIVRGANIENASYGLTICAERTAAATAAASGALRPGNLAAVAVALDGDGVASPCGACRQVLLEFGRPETAVMLHNLRDGSTVNTTLGTLLPMAFGPGSMRPTDA